MKLFNRFRRKITGHKTSLDITGWEIIDCDPINSTDNKKVDRLVQDILKNGWNGPPILVEGTNLVTGSHRRAALQKLFNMRDDAFSDGDYVTSDRIDMILSDDNIGEDVSDLMDSWRDRMRGEYGSEIETPYDNLEQIFTGTWVEDYKKEIAEW